MKKIPTPLQVIYDRPTSSTCFLVKVVSKTTGEAFGFTTLDTDVHFNDGAHDLIYSAEEELRPQNLQQESSYETDNTQLVGWFSDVIQSKILAGAMDSGEITMYRVAYLNLGAGAEVLAYGMVGDIDFSANDDGKRSVEFRGLTELLQNKIVPLYSLTCRAAFGDDRCGMPFVWSTGFVYSVGDNPQTDLVIHGVDKPDNYYVLGIIEFTSGQNAGKTIEVESWAHGGKTHLSFLTPFPMAPGDQLRIRQDCDKTETSCKAYGNIINMRAEHLTPVQDKAIMVPGAYVKSVGAQ